MATYVNLDHPQVIIQLANPSGEFDVKKDIFQIKGDYILALYDPNLRYLGFSSASQGAPNKKVFPAMKKGLFSSKVNGYLLFIRRTYIDGMVKGSLPEMAVVPDAKTILGPNGPVIMTQISVRLNAGIKLKGIGLMLKKMDFLKGDGKANICLTQSNINAVCEACLGRVLKEVTFDSADGLLFAPFNLDIQWRTNGHFRRHLDAGLKVVNQQVFPDSFAITVARTNANSR